MNIFGQIHAHTCKAWVMYVLRFLTEVLKFIWQALYSPTPAFGVLTHPLLPWQRDSRREWGVPVAEAIPPWGWLLSSAALSTTPDTGLEHVLRRNDLNMLDIKRTLLFCCDSPHAVQVLPSVSSSRKGEITFPQNDCIKVIYDELGRVYLLRDLLKGKAWMQIKDNAQDLIRNIHNTYYHLYIIHNLIYLVNN